MGRSRENGTHRGDCMGDAKLNEEGNVVSDR